MRFPARAGRPHESKSPLGSERHRTCNLADRHRISDPQLCCKGENRQSRVTEPALVRKSGLEGVRCTGSGQDDRAAGDLGRVLLHDGRGVLDGEEAAARSRRGVRRRQAWSERRVFRACRQTWRKSRQSLGARSRQTRFDAHLRTLTRMTSITPSSSRCSSVMFRPVVPALAKKKSRRPFSENACSQTERIKAESAASPVKAVTCRSRVG